MISAAATLTAFSPEHLEAATRLSQQAGWPHRREDWQVALTVSKGCVAVAADGRVIGTVLMTPYGGDAGTINMVIVDEGERGQGLGRRLMLEALTLAGDRRLQLVATADGLPLYEKLGFRRTGEIVQHQGHLRLPIARTERVRAAVHDDLGAVTALDAAAFGADRRDLVVRLAGIGEVAVFERDGRIAGFAMLRRFGRGFVIGPVVAPALDDAQALIAHFLAGREGDFIRLDTGTETGLAPWLAGLGLADVGGGMVMRRPVTGAAIPPTAMSFALASQAFG